MDLSLNFLNRKKPQENLGENLGEWKDPQITHHNTDDLSVATDFMCMYCLDVDSYRHFLNTSVDLGVKPYQFTIVPYSPDWASFKRHMYSAHPEQWGYDEVPESYFHITKSRTSWNKNDKSDVADAYIQIRARLEYGWNFFAVINGTVHRTLHSLPKNEEAITSIEWYPRINPLTNKPWTDWRFEREGETHKRAQNILPRIVGRTHASITPILRGTRTQGPRSHGSEGHVLEPNATRLSKYAHLPSFVNTTCIFTDRALKQVQDLRDICGLSGPGNIGILRVRGNHTVSTSTTSNTKINEEKTVQQEPVPALVPEEKFDINGSNINAQDIATKLEQLLPQNDFTKALLAQVEVIFTVAREYSTTEDAFYQEHEEHEATKLELNQAQVEADEAADEAEKAQTTIKELQAQIAKLTAKSTKVHKEFDDVAKKSKEHVRRHPRIT